MTQMTLQQAMELAVRQHQAGRLAEAEAIYRQILSAQPDQPDALHLLGVIACQADRFDQAVDLIRRAISLQPNSADFYGTLGNALQSLARYDEAIDAYQRGLSLNPAHAEILNNLGCALRDTKQIERAVDAFRQAIALRPQYPQALNNLANAMLDAGQFQQASEHLRKSLSLEPNLAETHNSIGALLERQAQYPQAIDSYRRGLALAPNHVEAHVNLGIALLREGDYSAGWNEYEWRLQRKDMREFALKLSGKPRWNPAAPVSNGQTILLYAEQGLGDTIQLARYIPLVAQRGGRIILRCPTELRRLLCNLPGLQITVGDSETLPDFDFHCPLASLPFVFGTTLETIPNPGTYLHADESSARSWALRFDNSSNLKVGLAWAGRVQHRDDRNRSISLSMMKELIHQHDATFVSLQKGPASAQLAEFSDTMIDWTGELNDLADTAALIQSLDLVITVDTSIAHLAGALGKPVWVPVPHVPDWRWLLDRSDSPWYPTMRLFRQPAIGHWKTPIERISQGLCDLKRNS